MSIASYFTKTFTVNRMVWNNESSSEVSQSSFKGHLQQASAELSESLGLSFTKTFKIWCDDSVNIQEQDSITDGSFTFVVRAINYRNYNLFSTNQHKEIIIERTEIV
jgi:hypothetical protein